MLLSLMKYELTPSGCLGVNMFIPLDASHERQQTRGEWVANGWRMVAEWQMTVKPMVRWEAMEGTPRRLVMSLPSV